MAGYFIYTIDNDVFSQLTTSPTREQGIALADYIHEDLSDEADAATWPQDRDALAEAIFKRLALPDWYSDLSVDDANTWEDIIFSLQDEPGETIGLDFQCSDYESIYWDCAEIAAKQGATMMAEPTFGNSGFRYFGKPSRYSPIYLFFRTFAFHFLGICDRLPDQWP